MRSVAAVIVAAVCLAVGAPAFAQPQPLPGEPPPPDLEVEDDDEEKEAPPVSPPDGEGDETSTPEGREPTAPSEPAQPPPPAEMPPSVVHSYDDVACEPRPQWATGLVLSPPPHEGWRPIPRLLLAPLQRSLVLVFTPLRYGVWTWERYQLKRRVQGIFFDDTLTYGLYPVVMVETQFGFSVGARFIHKNLFGERERLKLRATYGGRFNQEYSATITTGDRIDWLELRFDISWERWPKARFDGIGNGDLTEVDEQVFIIDPITDDTAIETRFGQDIFRVSMRGEAELGGHFWLNPALAFTDFSFGTNTMLQGDPFLPDVYDEDRVIGFEEGVRTLYPELELAYINTETRNKFIPEAAPSSGIELRLFGGWVYDVDREGYPRYGADVAGYIDLYRGTRVIALRHYIEAVYADLETASFVDLPRLGGPTLLRGYGRDRFRDRVAMVSTAEYRWLVFHSGFAYLFVDAGRVFRDFSSITLNDYRIGYGAGLQFHDRETYGARAQIAGSEDGVFLNFTFDRSFQSEPRVKRE